MSQIVQLKRSALSGKVPGTGSLNLGELALNTYDGKIFFRRSGSTDTIQEVVTTNSTVTGSIRLEGTGSFGSLKVNDTLTINHGETIISGSALVTSDLTILGAVNARQFNISVISSSVLFQSGSTRFGNTSDDTHDFTGSINVTGSLYVNGTDLAAGNAQGTYVFPNAFDFNVDDTTFGDFNSASLGYNLNFGDVETVGSPIHFVGGLSNLGDTTVIYPTSRSIDFVVDDRYVSSISSQSFYTNTTFTASLQQGYTWVGNSSGVSYAVATSSFGGALPSGVVSGSSQLTSSVLATTGSNTFRGTQTLSGSIMPAIDNTYDLGSATYQWRDIYVSSGSLYIDGTKVLGSTGNELQITTDVGQSIKILEAGSDNIILQSADGNIELKSSGGGNLLFDPTSGLIDVRGTLQIQDGNKITSSGGNSIVFGNNIVVSGSLESTGNINGINISTFSSSIASTFLNQNTATSSYETKGRGIVSGSSQITFSGISSLPTLVSGSSQITYANISSIPSDIVSSSSQVLGGTGIVSGSSQLNNTSIENLTVINLTTVNETASVIFSSGSNRFGDFGDDTHSFTGSVKISGSFTLIGSSTATSYNGIINATNGIVSGSSQITYASISSIPGGIVSGSSQTIANLPTGTVSGSSQVVGILGSLNTYTSSQDTKNSTLATYTGSVSSQLSNLNTATSSYETKGRSIVSGSSQIVGSSITTNTITIGSTSTALGGTSTTLAGLTSVTSTGFTGALTGNASTATTAAALTTARTINGTSFDGSANITIPNLVTGSAQISLTATTGYGTYINQAVLTTSSPTFAGATFSGNVLPEANGTRDLGSTSYRWSTVYTSDLSLNNGIGDWTIVEGEDDLFLYNNKKGKVYKFTITEVDPSVATPKKS